MLLELTEIIPHDRLSDDRREDLALAMRNGKSSHIDNVVLRPLILNSDYIVTAYLSAYEFTSHFATAKLKTHEYPCIRMELYNGNVIFVKADSLDELKMQLALNGQKLD